MSLLAPRVLSPWLSSISGAEASGISSSSGACCSASASDAPLGGVLCGEGGGLGRDGLGAGLLPRAGDGGSEGFGAAEEDPGLGISKGALRVIRRDEFDLKKKE